MTRTGNCHKYVRPGLVAGIIFVLGLLNIPFSFIFLTAEAADDLGWVENHAALGTSRMQGPVCRGSFVWQEDAGQANSDKVRNSQLRILADNAEKRDGFIELSGGVILIAGNLTINSENALYEEELQRVRLSGKVDFSSPQLISQAFDATYQRIGTSEQVQGQDKNKKNNSKIKQDPEYVIELTNSVFSQPESHIHGSGSSLIYEGSVVIIKDAKVSFCEPSENTWHLSGKEIRLNLDTMQGRARGAKFHLGETPVLYLGYLPFPLGDKRQSGFLAPDFNYNSHSGFIYNHPIYLNLAPNYDSTIYPQFLQKQGFLWEQDFRWLTAAGTGALGVGYIHRDALYGDARAAQYFKFSSVVNQGWSGEIDWSGVSDKEYFRDLPSVIPASGDFALPRFAHVRYATKGVDWILGVRDYQFIALNEEDFLQPYVNLPYSRLSLYSNSAVTGLYVESSLDYSSFNLDDNRSDSGISGAAISTNADTDAEVQVISGDNSRLHNDFTIGWQAPFRWGQIHSRINWQGLDYKIDKDLLNRHNIPSDDAIRRNYYYFDTDAYLSFSRQINEALCNCYLTFEPRVYGLTSRQDSSASADDLADRFTTSGFFDATPKPIDYDYLFSPRRFHGLDRYAAEERFSVGLQSRLIDLAGKGVYAFRVGSIVSESIKSPDEYFANASDPWAADLSFNFGSNNFFRLDVAGAADELHSQGLTFSHANHKKSGISMTYRKQENKFYQDEGHQLANNFVWYIVPRWSLFGGWRYNLDTEEMTNSVAGFGYENCCFNTVVGGFSRQNNNRDDSGVMLQFSFNPLGSLGSSGSTGFATLASGKIEDIYRQFR